MTDQPIEVVRDVPALRARIAAWRAAGERVALVPTMGALHEGHLALVAAGLARAARVVVTLFVNPTQFGPREDFARYPRQEAQDRDAAGRAGAALLYAPDVPAMYPDGFATTVTVAGGLTETLEGAFRPGHFAGVATVVAKLLLQARPDLALFGEKDYQQLQVIRRMAADLDLGIEIVPVPTVRDADGLALSSRNVRLDGAGLAVARRLHAILQAAAARLAAEPDSIVPALAAATAALTDAGFGPIDYVAAVDAASLAPLERLDRPGRLLAAAHVGGVRLIDNIPLAP